MKDMTDRELLDAIDRAMKTVVERFKARREAEDDRAAASVPPPTPVRTDPPA